MSGDGCQAARSALPRSEPATLALSATLAALGRRSGEPPRRPGDAPVVEPEADFACPPRQPGLLFRYESCPRYHVKRRGAALCGASFLFRAGIPRSEAQKRTLAVSRRYGRPGGDIARNVRAAPASAWVRFLVVRPHAGQCPEVALAGARLWVVVNPPQEGAHRGKGAVGQNWRHSWDLKCEGDATVLFHDVGRKVSVAFYPAVGCAPLTFRYSSEA